jgi:hypothetical protein
MIEEAEFSSATHRGIPARNVELAMYVRHVRLDSADRT